MTDDLERRLMEALDARARPADDPALADALTDPEFARTAAEFESLDGWLQDWQTPAPTDAEFDAIARRIEQRLGEAFDDADATQPPVFDDPDARVRTLKGGVSSGSYSLAALTAPAPPSVVSTGPGLAVVLGEKRAPSRIPAFLAVAAMVGLAVTGGLATMSSRDAPMMASAESAADPNSLAPAAAPGQAPVGAADGFAETEAADEPRDFAPEPEAAALEEAAEEMSVEADDLGSAPETTHRDRPSPGRDRVDEGGGRGGGVATDDAFGARGSVMASTMTRSERRAPPAPPTASAADQGEREVGSGGESSLEDRLRACTGERAPARVSLQLTVADRRVTAVRVRSPSSLASQSACFVRALRDERFDGGPQLERTYRLSP